MKIHPFIMSIQIICMLAASYAVYCLILQDDSFFLLIDPIMGLDQHASQFCHFLIVGLLPVCIAIMIFGSAMIGTYLSAILLRWINYINVYKKAK